jgi:hypothetical protein
LLLRWPPREGEHQGKVEVAAGISTRVQRPAMKLRRYEINDYLHIRYPSFNPSDTGVRKGKNERKESRVFVKTSLQ